MYTKLILRFRDLACEPGQTIERHKAVITANGYVYWGGWWSKTGGEKFENSFLDNISEVFLFDSGQLKIYKATIIDFEVSHTRIKSPEVPFTPPDYYSDNKFLMWLKMSNIEEVELNTEVAERRFLNGYSYCHNPLFFEAGEKYFVDFNDKIISSMQELKKTKRELFGLLEKKNDTDKIHEILLNERRNTIFQQFSEDFLTCKESTFLWLSDLHFSKDYHEFSKSNNDFSRTLASTIYDYCNENNIKLAGVIVTGDFSYKAENKEFKAAKDFLETLLSLMSLKPENLIICPGNHDFKFAIGGDVRRTGGKLKIKQTVLREYKNYRQFYTDLFEHKPQPPFSMGRRYILDRSMPIEIISINSVTLQQVAKEFQGYGYVSDLQLSTISKKYGLATDN